MPQVMSITTKRGDKGFTDLLFGGKVSKGDPQIEALGAVDELNANLGIARVLLDGEIAKAIDQIQEWLVTLMGELAMPFGKEIEYEKAGFGRISTTEIQWLEDWSASIEKEEKFKGWLRPGERGGELSAWTDLYEPSLFWLLITWSLKSSLYFSHSFPPLLIIAWAA